MPNMYEIYKKVVVPALKQKRGYKNDLQVPRLRKIVLTSGIGTKMEKDVFNEAKEHFAVISGQQCLVTKSKKDVANFKLRKGTPVGVMVTLRGQRMYDFLDRLTHYVLPRVRDFRGIPKTGFDGSGNYNFGLSDITVFPEVDLDKVKRQIGLNITFVTSAKSNEEAFDLLHLLDMPFATESK
ncbi:MAG TPA: 50S ribosomal protein L5 [Lentisphaeria bacterium]|nr:MAG: 50S ribosomal protein L5 [Lentisphaerae bacterium GWF2_49_21]HBC85517.1 50S ribosomal protein L5 [Lentisphaeria bacterium]